MLLLDAYMTQKSLQHYYRRIDGIHCYRNNQTQWQVCMAFSLNYVKDLTSYLVSPHDRLSPSCRSIQVSGGVAIAPKSLTCGKGNLRYSQD
jgi:hypothetical protein